MMSTETTYTTSSLDRDATLERVRALAHMMDSHWRIPGTRIRFGADSVLGLIPGTGDVAGLAVSAYALYLAHRLGAPRHVMLRMVRNTAIDAGVGAIPLVGDVFDLFFKSNTKNLRLLMDHLENPKPN